MNSRCSERVDFSDQFPCEIWEVVQKWIARPKEEELLYFVGVVGRDVAITGLERQELETRGVKLSKFLINEIFRRLGKSHVSSGDIILMKREGDRLGLMEKEIDFVFDNVKSENEKVDMKIMRQELEEAIKCGEFRPVTNPPSIISWIRCISSSLLIQFVSNFLTNHRRQLFGFLV